MYPIPIPEQYFYTWTMDLITNLPDSNSFHCIFTFINKLMKFTVSSLCTTSSNHLIAEETVSLFSNHIVNHFGLLLIVLHDHEPHFTKRF